MKDFELREFAKDLVATDKFLSLSSNYAKQSNEGETSLCQMLVKLILNNAEAGEFKTSPAMTMKLVLFVIRVRLFVTQESFYFWSNIYNFK